MMRTKFYVPALIVAYNMFMNAVDRFDQKRAACAILRKELRVSQSIFTWILDAACINANALRSKLGVDEIALPEFKRRVALDLVRAYITTTGGNTWNKRKRNNELTRMFCRETSLATAVAPGTQTTIRCHHVLVENKPNKRQVFPGRCILCSL